MLFAECLLLYFAILRKIANFSVSCFFTFIKRSSRYLKNGCFDWADFLTQDSSHPYAQNEPWNKPKNLKKKVMTFLLSVHEGIFFQKLKFLIFQWKIEISLIPWLILSRRVTRILCKKISQIERSVVEISWAPFFTHVSIKSRITGEKLKSVKNGKNLIIHISHKEHNAKRISSIAFIFQKLVE